MKFNKATYYSIFFLCCFLASFGVNAAKSITIAPLQQQVKKQFSLSYNQKDESRSDVNDFLFEENENEDEHDFAIQAFIVPFFKACLLAQEHSCKIISVNPITEKLSNPIYLKVRNFRI